MTNHEYNPEMSMVDYLHHPGISSSQMRKAMKSPAHYHASRNGSSESTEAMEFGTMVHTMVLEPEKFDDEYVLFLHEGDKRKKTENGGCLEHWKAAKADMAETGKLLVDKQMYDKLLKIRASVMSHPTVKAIFAQKHIIEATCIWDDELIGAKCKARPDILTESGVMADLKTTQNASPKDFARSAANFGYPTQAFHHRTGANACRESIPLDLPESIVNIIIAVESEANVWNPETKEMDHAVVVYEMTEEDIQSAGVMGQLALRGALSEPPPMPTEAYGLGIQQLNMPDWYRN